MDEKQAISESSLAFLSANRAPGKRQIRVVNRDDLVSSLLAAPSDDEDDDDFCEQSGSDGSSDTGDSSEEDLSDEAGQQDEDEEDVDGEKAASDLSESMDVPHSSACSISRSTPTDAPEERDEESICCLCLNFRYGSELVIKCDLCGLNVHEDCYGIGDNESNSSATSSESTEPWFCEPCLAGLNSAELRCELCPKLGGPLKRTDSGGRWVHLLCALYIPGCTFGDLERLSPVCLYEIGYNRYGAKACAACYQQNRAQARTGVCVKCDAGLCKMYYHVTCAQKIGLLVDGSASGEIKADTEADPYFLCCPAHSNRASRQMKQKRMASLDGQVQRFSQRSLTSREQRMLEKRRGSYASKKAAQKPVWTLKDEKWQRLLPTSAEYLEKMRRKAELTAGITREQWESSFRVEFSSDMMGKFIMPPAFSSDFVLYFAEREKLLPAIDGRIHDLNEVIKKLRTIQDELKAAFDVADCEKRRVTSLLKEEHDKLSSLCALLKRLGSKDLELPRKLRNVPVVEQPRSKASNNVRRSSAQIRLSERSSDEPAAVDSVRTRSCANCGQSQDQHLLTQCDTCRKHYHISCLDPPLTKLPKKTSLYGWQCSNCGNSSSEESETKLDLSAPRRLRTEHKPVSRFLCENTGSYRQKSISTDPMLPQRASTVAKRRNQSDHEQSPPTKKKPIAASTKKRAARVKSKTAAEHSENMAPKSATMKKPKAEPLDSDERKPGKPLNEDEIEKSVEAVLRRVSDVKGKAIDSSLEQEDEDYDDTDTDDASSHRKKGARPPRRGEYQNEAMDNAVKAVMEGEMGAKRASAVYGVPRSTIGRRVRCLRGMISKKKSQNDVEVIRVEDLD